MAKATRSSLTTAAPKKSSLKVKAVSTQYIPPKTSAIEYSFEGEPGDEEYQVIAKNGKDEFEFNLDVSDVPHCCGINEIGNFNIRSNDRTISEKDKVEGVRRLLTKIIEHNTSGKTCRTLYFTLVDNAGCNLIAKAIADGTMFTEVKTFVNSNTGRQNVLYVSNN